MQSISGITWEEIQVNKRIKDKLKIDLGYSDLISKLIISRDFTKIEIDSISHLIDIFNPFLKNLDFEKSQIILKKSLDKNKNILIIGDYDVDGCVSTSLMVNFLKKIGNKINFYIPNRFDDGYGANIELIKKLLKKVKPDLIIMLDCGSSSNEAVNFLKLNNKEIIIIDHHEIYPPYPDTKYLINPKKECDYKEYDYLCSSVLTYFFLDYFIKKNKLHISIEDNLVYVVLAIICDVMPLRSLNRLIIINYLKNFSIKKNYIFKKIYSLKNINKPFELDDFGFLIGPILNSAGRLGDANKIVHLLTSKNKEIIDKLLLDLIKTNEKRKKIENDFLKKIDFEKIKTDNDDVIVLYDKFLNEGLIGIIASRLKDHFNKPTIVLTKSNNILKASARSTPNFNIGKYIKLCIDKKIIMNGGGHNLAAGFTIKKENLNIFKTYINKIFKEKKITQNKKEYISELSLTAINKSLFNDLKMLTPYGANNITPSFLIRNVIIIKPKIIKEKFLSFYLKSKSSKLFPAISFNNLESIITKMLMYNKNEFSVIVQIKENQWNNKKNLQLVVLDIITQPNKA